MDYNENDVVMAMKSHKDAFGNLYKSIYTDLFKMSFYIIGNREQAKDIVSETVLDAYIGITRLRDSTKFEQWILKILICKCNKKMREKYEKITMFNPKVSSIEQYNLKQSDSYNDNEIKTDVQIALGKLGKDERMIISLCIVEGFKSYEVAEILSMNASTVRSKLNRGLKKMRKYLEVETDER